MKIWAAFNVFLVVGIKINTYLPGPYEQNLLCILHLPGKREVDMRFDLITCGPFHVAELLREVIGSDKTNPVLIEFSPQDDA